MSNNSCSELCVKECWQRPWSRCLQDCRFCRGGHLLAVLVILPFLGRLLGEKALSRLKDCLAQRCCSAWCQPDDEEQIDERAMIATDSSDSSGSLVYAAAGRPAARAFTFYVLVNEDTDRHGVKKPLQWKDARLRNRESKCGAAATALARVLLWHWLQPLLYFVALYCAWKEDGLEGRQLFLGVAVGVRELLYLVSTCLCIISRPSFLLVDPTASYKDRSRIGRGGINLESGQGFLAMYILAPEKFVTYALFKDKGKRFIACVISVLLDLCGVVALFEGVMTGELTFALGIGYGATAAGGTFALGLFACEKRVEAREQRAVIISQGS